MIEWMFVAIVCINSQCQFIISNPPVDKKACISLKKDFLSMPFKKEITFAAAQCMELSTGEVL